MHGEHLLKAGKKTCSATYR